jgi:NADPH-dependent 2,4-dienoyl-CoA reductase/sulfur reductase-like enzyme
MSKRIVIVGGVAAGASAAAKARRVSEDVEIVLVEAGKYVSFANCGLPYYVGGEIARREDLFVVTPQMFRSRFDIDVRCETVAAAVDPRRKCVTLVHAGDSQELQYDRLILATGTKAVIPPIPGLDKAGMFTVRTVMDVDAIVARLAEVHPAGGRATAGSEAGTESPARALVMGGGYIGLEMAEQLRRRGLHVTIVEMLPQLLSAMDPEMAVPVQSAMVEAGCEVVLGDAVARIAAAEGRNVAVTKSGRRVDRKSVV